MYRYRRAEEEQPTLEFVVEILANGALRLKAPVSEALESKIMVAMRNSAEKKCLKNGIFEVLLTCTRNSTPDEKSQRLEVFSRWLTKRSGVAVVAMI